MDKFDNVPISRLILMGLLSMLVIKPVFASDPWADLLKEEVTRQKYELRQAKYPPLYFDFQILDQFSDEIRSSFGGIISSQSTRYKLFSPFYLIGHQEDIFADTPNQTRLTVLLPLEPDTFAFRAAIWEVCNQAFSSAVQAYEKSLEKRKSAVSVGDTTRGFAPVKSVISIDPLPDGTTLNFERSSWEAVMQNITEKFRTYPQFVTGSATMLFVRKRNYFSSSDESSIAENRSSVTLTISASVRAEDGMIIPLYLHYHANHPSSLPNEKQLLSETEALIKRLLALEKAPLAEPYSGPAILSGEAAAVFFHEIFGHRVEGQRMKNDKDAQTFSSMIGESVLPNDFQVSDDPSLTCFDTLSLAGHYLFDDQGVPGQRVELVQNGTLRNVLMTRIPIRGFSQSNGHARANLEPGENSSTGFVPTSRQGNLLVSSTKPLSEKKLRKALIKELKVQKKPYGYRFLTVSGGFTLTGRYIPNSFNINPLETYRVYADGRPDQLVRGVDLIGTPLTMFSDITSAGSQVGVFNGMCGASSGWIPVSAISPSILVKKIETQRKSETKIPAPLLPPPR